MDLFAVRIIDVYLGLAHYDNALNLRLIKCVRIYSLNSAGDGQFVLESGASERAVSDGFERVGEIDRLELFVSVEEIVAYL